MIEDEARAADRLACAAHRYCAWAARKMSERTSPTRGEVPSYDQARVGGGRNAGSGKGQIIEIVGARAIEKGRSSGESHQAGAACVGAIVGPTSSDRVCEGASVECRRRPD